MYYNNLRPGDFVSLLGTLGTGYVNLWSCPADNASVTSRIVGKLEKCDLAIVVTMSLRSTYVIVSNSSGTPQSGWIDTIYIRSTC